MSQQRLYQITVSLVDLEGDDRHAIAAQSQIPFQDGIDDGIDLAWLEDLVKAESIKLLRRVQRTDREARVGER